MRCNKHRISLVDGECIVCTRGTDDTTITVLNSETYTYIPEAYYQEPVNSILPSYVRAAYDAVCTGRRHRETREEHRRRRIMYRGRD